MAYNVITQEAEQHTEIVFSENKEGLPQRIVLQKETNEIHLSEEDGEIVGTLVCAAKDLDRLIEALHLAKEWGWLSEQQEESE